METPTQLVSLDELDKPVLQTEDTTFPAPNSTDINPINGLRTDYRSADTHAITDEERASHSVGVSNNSPPIASLEGTADAPYSKKEAGGLHRQLFRNLFAKQGSSPPISPLATEESIVTTPTSAINVGRLISAYDTDSPDSGSECDMSDEVFSPPITTESNSPATPASDLEEYFSNISVSSDEDSADQKLSEFDLSDTGSLESLNTVYPRNESLEELVKAESAEMAKPTTMSTSESPDSPSDLDIFGSEELGLAPSESPPPSRTPSGASSLVLLAKSDGSVSRLPFDVISLEDGSIVVSISPVESDRI